MGGLKVMAIVGLCIMPVLSGCGGGSDFSGAQPTPSVDSLGFRDRTVPPNGTTSVRIEFNPGADITGYDIDGNPEFTSSRFTLIVSLPPGTEYGDDTSKITDSVFGDQIFGHPDHRDPDLIGACGDGRTILQYNFRRGEFGDPTTLDHGEVYLKFDLSVPPSAQGSTVHATSLINPPLSACATGAERSARITVDD